MKFLHISDTHLGYSQYGLSERKKDFLDVFHEAVDIAINENVDFVIHSGDFFHTSRPSNETFLDGIEIVRRLNDANIPIFTISGNHDRGSQIRDVSPLAILQSLGLKLVDTGFVEYEGVFIGGLKYISKAGLKQTDGIRVILEKYLENTKGKDTFKILMLHQEFQPFFPDSSLYIEQEIPEGFDYIGIGHYHIKQEPKLINTATVVYPGSTEFTAYNENEDKVEKGFYIVEVDNKDINCKFVELKNRRPFISKNIEEDNIEDSIKSLKEELEKLLDSSAKKPVVILKGNLKNLDIKDIVSILNKSGLNEEKVLHYRFNFSKENESLIETAFSGEDNIVFPALKELIKDEELFSVVEDVIKNLQTFENIDEVKKYLKDNPDVFQL